MSFVKYVFIFLALESTKIIASQHSEVETTQVDQEEPNNLTQLLEEVIEDHSSESIFQEAKSLSLQDLEELETEIKKETKRTMAANGGNEQSRGAKQPRVGDGEEDSFFAKMTGWLDPKLEAQADRYLTTMKQHLEPISKDLQVVKTEQTNQGKIIEKIEAEGKNFRSELTKLQAQVNNIGVASSSASSSPTPRMLDFNNVSPVYHTPPPRGQESKDMVLFIAGGWPRGVPTEVVEEQWKLAVSTIVPEVNYTWWEARRPTTMYLVFAVEGRIGRDSMQGGWAIANKLKQSKILPAGADPGSKDKFGRPQIIWCSPKRVEGTTDLQVQEES